MSDELRERVGLFLIEGFQHCDCDPEDFKDCPSYRYRTEGKCHCQEQTDAAIALIWNAAMEEAAKVAETCPHEDGWYTQGDRRRAEEIASEISRLRGEAESYKRALVFCEDRIANCAGELANLRATNERLGWAVESAAVVFEQVYGNAELAEKVRAAALTATQETRNG